MADGEAQVTNSGPTFEEVDTAIKKQIADNVARLESVTNQTIASAHEQFHQGIEAFMQHDKRIIVSLHAELSIFKRLWAHIQAATLNEEVVKDTLNDLNEHSESVRKQQQPQTLVEARN